MGDITPLRRRDEHDQLLEALRRRDEHDQLLEACQHEKVTLKRGSKSTKYEHEGSTATHFMSISVSETCDAAHAATAGGLGTAGAAWAYLTQRGFVFIPIGPQ